MQGNNQHCIIIPGNVEWQWYMEKKTWPAVPKRVGVGLSLPGFLLEQQKGFGFEKKQYTTPYVFFNGVIYNDDIINLFHPVLLKNAGCPSLLTAPRNAIPKNGNVGKDNDIF